MFCSAVYYNIINVSVMGLWLNGNVGADGGELDIGGTNPLLYVPPLIYLPVVGGFDYWKVQLDSVNIVTTSLTSPLGSFAVFDTSTAYISGPTSNTTIINGIIGGTQQPDGRDLLNCGAIETYPNVTFVLSGNSFVLTPFQYVVFDALTSQCFSPFVGKNYTNPCGPAIWVLGLAFLRAYYSSYDIVNNQVGLAPAVSPT